MKQRKRKGLYLGLLMSAFLLILGLVVTPVNADPVNDDTRTPTTIGAPMRGSASNPANTYCQFDIAFELKANGSSLKDKTLKVVEVNGEALASPVSLQTNQWSNQTGIYTFTYSYSSGLTQLSFKVVFEGDETYAPSENTFTYTAPYSKYTVTPVDYNETCKTNISSWTVIGGQKATEPKVTATYEGWEFDGWYTDTTYATKFDFNTTILKDTKIYAKWRQVDIPVTEVNLTYSGYGAYQTIGDIEVESQTKGIEIVDVTVKKLNTAGTGWTPVLDSELASPNTSYQLTVYFKSKDGYAISGVSQSAISLEGVGAPLNYLYVADGNSSAVFSLPVLAEPEFTLKFETDGGDTIKSVTGIHGETIDLTPYVPTKTGSAFYGWYEDAALTKKVDAVEIEYADRTVYAKWKVNVEAPAGLSGVAPNSTGGADGKITGTSSAMEYRLQGSEKWTDCPDNGLTGLAAGTYEVRYKETETHAASAATVVVVSAPAQYTLSFETNGGSAIATVTKDRGSVIDLANYRPTKDGYTFAGWYQDAELTQQAGEVQLKDADVRVYAKWTKNTPGTETNEGASNAKQVTKTKLPKTGEDTSPLTYFAAMALAVGGLTALSLGHKRAER